MCYLNQPNEIVEKQLKEALLKKEYHKWNLTSINNMNNILNGDYSDDCKSLAIILLKEYIEYSKNRW